jgi:DNA-cytosine methyltransferase
MNGKVVDNTSDGERTLISRSQFSLPESSAWKQILLLEDNSARALRRKTAGVTTVSGSDVIVRFHRIGPHGISIAGENAYSPGKLSERVGVGGRTTLALELLDSIRASTRQSIVVAGPRYGGNQAFTNELKLRGLNWIVELPRRVIIPTDGHPEGKAVTDLLLSARKWIVHDIALPITGKTITYSVVHLGFVPLGNGEYGQLFAAQTGAITGIHQGTIFGFSSMPTSPLDDLLRAIGWARWIRPLVRLEERSLLKIASHRASSNGKHSVELTLRSNIKLARQQDELALWNSGGDHRSAVHRGVLKQQAACLNVAELFAGAGGMGLGFLLAGGNAGGYRLRSSAEVHPIYVETLRANHTAFARFRDRTDVVPETLQPMDLRTTRSLDALEHSARQSGGTDVLIGGPPCQGFSNANRNSWHRANPHNELVDVFLKYVRRLKPKIFLMENVQGIIWTQKHGRSGGELTVVNSIAQRMARYGYLVFPKLLDAVWFGVPQYRSRFFLLGIHTDLGYRKDDFGEWGPYPLPTHGPGTPDAYTTVRDAIRDLPRIGNGHEVEEAGYRTPSASELGRNPYLRFLRANAVAESVSDHVTSRHADYVLERYRQIPQGGNWEDISDSLTNYADVQRTHSNIYRRLSWNEPSITIGHYRKSMLIHPSQNRGLSLREAARLQSFPDWFRFCGNVDGRTGGLMHKQQQLANAVCPLVTKSIAEYLLWL